MYFRVLASFTLIRSCSTPGSGTVGMTPFVRAGDVDANKRRIEAGAEAIARGIVLPVGLKDQARSSPAFI